ncbi:MAG: hypothetical protein PPP58_10275 [Natronomonas sp.]
MTTVYDRPDEPPAKKATFICSACGHESPVDGDWDVDTRADVDGGTRTIACPECGHTIVEQPRFSLLA